MARTPSNMLALGTVLPDFLLPDTVSGRVYSSNELNGAKASLLMFICNHCPFVKHVNDGIVKLANDYESRGVRFVAISSNDAEQFPEDGPDKMKENAFLLNFPF